MKRLSPTGLLLVLAFAIPVLVELRTLLALVGVYITTTAYVGIALSVIVGLVVWTLIGLNSAPRGGELR